MMAAIFPRGPGEPPHLLEHKSAVRVFPRPGSAFLLGHRTGSGEGLADRTAGMVACPPGRLDQPIQQTSLLDLVGVLVGAGYFFVISRRVAINPAHSVR